MNSLRRRLTNLLTVDLHFYVFGLVRIASGILLGIVITMESQADSQDICTDFYKYACQNREVSAKADDAVGNLYMPYVFGGRAHRIYQEVFSQNLSTSTYHTRWLKFKEVMGAPFTADVIQMVKNYEALYTENGPFRILEQLDQQLAQTDGDSIKTNAYVRRYSLSTIISDVKSLLDSKKIHEQDHPVNKIYSKYLEESGKTDLSSPRAAIAALRVYCSVFPDALCRKQFLSFLKDWHQEYFEPAHEELGARPEFRTAVMERVFPMARRQQLQTILSDFKRIARDMFAGRLTDAELEKFNRTQFAWDDQSPTIAFQAIAYGQNALYDREATKNIVLLGGYSDISEYDLWRTIAHEYGHALDDEIGPHMKEVTAHLRQCLQRPTSIEAHHEQLKEAVADWIGTELLARYYSSRLSPAWPLKTLQKSTLHLGTLTCPAPEKSNAEPFLLGMKLITPHPTSENRVNRILMAHPYFRSLLGCSQKSDTLEYCEMP